MERHGESMDFEKNPNLENKEEDPRITAAKKLNENRHTAYKSEDVVIANKKGRVGFKRVEKKDN